MTALTLAVALALAGDPVCGARPGIEPARIVAVAKQESGLDPYAVGLNGPGGGAHHFSTAEQAIAYARSLDAAGRSYDTGLTGINNHNLTRDGLTLATAFDACASIRAAYHHLAGDAIAATIWTRAHMIYNTGSPERGEAYAAGIDRELARIRTVETGPAIVMAEQPPDPTEPPAWDLWAHQEWLDRKAEPSPEPPAPALLVTEATQQEHTP